MEFPHLPEEADCSWEYWEAQERQEGLKTTKDTQYHHPPHLGEVGMSQVSVSSREKDLKWKDYQGMVEGQQMMV